MRKALIAVAAFLAFTATAQAVPVKYEKTITRPDRDCAGGPDINGETADAVLFHCARVVRSVDHVKVTRVKHVAPEPEPIAPEPVETAAPTATSSGGCPASMAAEADSPTDVNPTSGASGCYQVLPSTAAAMGPACGDVNALSCVQAICASQGNGAWAASGATPC